MIKSSKIYTFIHIIKLLIIIIKINLKKKITHINYYINYMYYICDASNKLQAAKILQFV